ncbi:ribulose-phosphate 3-epimerase [Thermotoga maritima MSB8]|uniref:Ribulose-phosphate 3-epimerase n=1 Tax=Thermotoga maritima (strain ATCC 43589 / DSM 3109 / JCM 10099 / NBRC 100826 / MSB8) TaxID=243274 RepID=Q9X243_THEMA|nr:ribulose-phosphate 3-epimerase [Thermotoga maritima]AAD36784.1 ribulose-phosphate 3-epimerase [Thermotoga maritima MSB8]AGL50650.1 Ribulose-phosphate 3-epimerase [Thermotoga maritima MSB8]AHD18387.1 ribulose-phosphate 3-epimerase [Thermotoga maritima MSB8]AKE27601.1 ribulose-phosphate 3-epimerase [Thermotoga maritima]AKE29474.1 ribulose-phosphate 3-epimerase [Thermotoga maritima MSB8]
MVKIAASILACDLARLADEVKRVEEHVDMIHFDVMDGHFVPNISFGLPVLKALRKETKLPISVHLMITNPEDYIDRFIEEGADMVAIHYESTFHLHRLVHRVKDLGARAFVAINPHTPINLLSEIITDVDGVLVMSVNPGFSGQRFIARSLEKIRNLRKMVKELGLETEIMVDGGVNEENASILVKNGATILVMGYGIFRNDNYVELIKSIKQEREEFAD